MSSRSFPLVLLALPLVAADLPPNDAVKPVRLFEVPHYSEGVVFDARENGYCSHENQVTRFSPDGSHETWAVTGNPNGHKILPDGTHLVCDGTGRAVLRISAEGQLVGAVSWVCDGQPLRGPNDLSLDLAHGGFYFTDPGGSDAETPIGTVHYVDRDLRTHLVAKGLAFPNGIILSPDGKRLLVGESKRNRILEYAIVSPGKVSERKIFADLPTKAGDQIASEPDGICLDAAGNLYVAHYGMGQVQVLDPSGRLIRRYETGLLLTSNVAFGGPEHDQLFVTGSVKADGTPGAVVRLDLETPGLRILPRE